MTAYLFKPRGIVVHSMKITTSTCILSFGTKKKKEKKKKPPRYRSGFYFGFCGSSRSYRHAYSNESLVQRAKIKCQVPRYTHRAVHPGYRHSEALGSLRTNGSCGHLRMVRLYKISILLRLLLTGAITAVPIHALGPRCQISHGPVGFNIQG